jgi:hypothetical protein
MTDEQEQPKTNGQGGLDEEEDATLTVVKNMTLTQILGRVMVDNKKTNLAGKPAENNTRWVMDVDTDGKEPMVLQLLQFRSSAPVNPDLLSFSIAPTSPEAWSAQPWAQVEGGRLTVHTREKACSFRISVDVMHSATR